MNCRLHLSVILFVFILYVMDGSTILHSKKMQFSMADVCIFCGMAKFLIEDVVTVQFLPKLTLK